jgi:hypothetical protein
MGQAEMNRRSEFHNLTWIIEIVQVGKTSRRA